MALNAEYKRKIEYYIDHFPTYITTDVGTVEYSGFVTTKRLTFSEAGSMPREAFPSGMKWGYPGEYAWIFANVTVPKESDGKTLLYMSDNGECIVWVNGKIYGSLDREHKDIVLSESAVAGESFEIVMEVYAGSGQKGLESDHFTGPVNERTIHKLKHADGMLRTVKNGSLCVFDNELYSAYMNLRVLYELRNCNPADSQRTAEIDKALKEAVAHINFELPYDMMRETVKYADKLLAPALAAKNGSTALTMYAFGHSHLDLEWLWTDSETRRKIARTVGNQLRMIKKYPEYKYLQPQPWLLDVLKNEYPELYAEVKEAVKAGNFIVDGAMWVEPDLNLPSGESLIRQMMYGKRFIMEEFGIDSRMVWLPDVFGCGCSLPQIIKGCDADYFFNSKLPWVYNGGNPIPRSTFMWRGIDGTTVPTHIISGYGAECKPNVIKRQAELYQSKELAPIMALAFGYSDGGGGATREHMEYMRREADLEGMPKMKMSTPAELFEGLCDAGITDEYRGELYYCAHRGTYTAQAKTKLLNRRAELALRDAEMANALFGGDDRAVYERLWKTVLFNQFHDILPGSAVGEVYTATERELAEVVTSANERTCDAVSAVLTEDKNSLTLFNSLSWDRKANIILPDGVEAASFCDGSILPSQKCDDGVHVLADVPACGTVSIKLERGKSPATVDTCGLTLENDLVSFVFDRSGEITSIIDKENGCEYLAGRANRFAMYADMPLFCDAWDIDSYYEDNEIDISDITEISAITSGALFSSLTVKKKIGESVLCQKVILQNGKKQLDFVTDVEWKETHKLLKVYFDTNLNSSVITSEMQFGHVDRPAHRNDSYAKERFEVCQHKWSALCENKRIFSLLNDCKYGIGANNGSIGLTLLKSSTDPDFNADKGTHRFTYSIMLSNDITDTVKAAWELNVPAVRVAGAAKSCSAFTLSADNVIIDTVKAAEDGSGDVIVRLYECSNSMTKCQLLTSLPVKRAYVTDMIENNKAEAMLEDNGISLTLRGFEVVTLRLILK